jgi:hypothetical protein
VILALLACVPALAEGPHAGALVAREAGCNLCHTGPDLASPGRVASCTECHAWIHKVSANPDARAKAMAAFPKWERYERNVRSYATVPDLGVAFARLDSAWLRRWLADPHDVRPAMDEGMPRLGLTDAQLDAIVAWAGTYAAPVAPTPRPSPANVSRGETLFRDRGCAGCHAFGARSTSPHPFAPDLAHARQRLTDDAVVAWIVDPAAMSTKAAMPTLGLTVDEAVALRDYLVLADPGGKAPASPPPAPAPAPGATWDVLDERVFGKICAHCHMDPAQNEGRAGPGNAGGFGWAATGLELQTCTSVRDHKDAIVAAMLRRRDEAVRDHVRPGEAPATITRPSLPGMPLGLPPIPDADLALVLGWDGRCP